MPRPPHEDVPDAAFGNDRHLSAHGYPAAGKLHLVPLGIHRALANDDPMGGLAARQHAGDDGDIEPGAPLHGREPGVRIVKRYAIDGRARRAAARRSGAVDADHHDVLDSPVAHEQRGEHDLGQPPWHDGMAVHIDRVRRKQPERLVGLHDSEVAGVSHHPTRELTQAALVGPRRRRASRRWAWGSGFGACGAGRGTRGLPLRATSSVLRATILALVATPALAQRAPVLRQIDVPHAYYYREMYLPQLTSGPSGAAWSPDGAELVYSMGGTLWRQRIGSSEARQLTAGPGYDYQPDWSPDGRYVTYASYRDDAVELRLLDLVRDTTMSLVAGGAVSVEPRWSPDGSRIAYVSTAHEGRWHLYTVAVRGGAAGAVQRLSEDVESGLPRYYYNRYDHYLSPTWSPDGAELIFVCNAGHIWGSGGFWRMAARAGAPARQIHDEETTWKARPDWSRDGKRVVYSSYQGRQWNQLWLMTAEGGDPFQLTYGDFDATSPRWSPDGTRIAYISNEGGNTTLWVIDVPGGRRQQVIAAERRHRGPVGLLRVEVVDGATGLPLAARLSVTGPDGRSHAPDDAWHHADDAFDRNERRFEYGYFHMRGAAELTVPAGSFTIEATRGLEYRAAALTVAVRPDATQDVRITLERLADMAAAGWHAADLHVHMNYGGTYRNTPERLALQAEAEGLALIENLIVNKEGRIPDVAYFSGGAATFANGVVIKHDQEFHTSFWGHLGLLGLTDHLLLPDYAAYVNTAGASLAPVNATVSALTRHQEGVVGYVHPFDFDPEPADRATALTHALPVDVALGAVDYLEVVGFSDHRVTERVWHRLLSCGFRIPAGAGTDAMANFASLRGPVGMNRVYARVDGPIRHRAWLDALKAGRTFVTNGPLLDFNMADAGPGGALRLPAPRDAVPVRVTLRSIVPVDHLEIVRDGDVAVRVPLPEDRTSVAAELVIPVQRSGWYALRAWSERAIHPVLDVYPFATTGPIYVAVDGHPAPPCPDAGYFQAWIDRVEEAVLEHSDWNTDAERRDVLEMLAAARAEYGRRAASEDGDR